MKGKKDFDTRKMRDPSPEVKPFEKGNERKDLGEDDDKQDPKYDDFDSDEFDWDDEFKQDDFDEDQKNEP